MTPTRRTSHPRTPRRTLGTALAVAGTLAAGLLTGCGAPTGTGAGRDAQTGAFPVSIQNTYGTTTVPERPERVVSIGFHEQDALLALGVQPVAVQQWMSQYPTGFGPWAQPLVKRAPKLFPSTRSEPDIAAVAELRPDLIVGTYASVSQKQYDLLSQIAPTLVRPKRYADFQVPYEEETLAIGRALGREDRARRLVRDTRQAFAAARAKHPEFRGRTVAVAYPLKNGSLGLFSSADPRGQFFRDLGFTIPKRLDALTDGAFFKDVSPERLDLVGDVDLLVVVDFGLGDDVFDGSRLYHDLPVVRAGHAIYPLPYTDPISFNTVLSVPYCIDKVSPVVARALAAS